MNKILLKLLTTSILIFFYLFLATSMYSFGEVGLVLILLLTIGVIYLNSILSKEIDEEYSEESKSGSKTAHPVSIPSNTADQAPQHHAVGMWIVIAVTVFAVIVFIIICFGGSGESQNTIATPTTEATKPVEIKAAVYPKAPPSNGYIFEEITVYEGVAPLTIDTSGEDGYYFVLDPIQFDLDESQYSDEFTFEFESYRAQHYADISELRFYVRGGNSVELLVPLGTYELYYATGSVWYGEENLFGRNTTYQKCDDTFEFTKDSSGYNGWTLTLYPVENGNMDTDIINEEDFPK